MFRKNIIPEKHAVAILNQRQTHLLPKQPMPFACHQMFPKNIPYNNNGDSVQKHFPMLLIAKTHVLTFDAKLFYGEISFTLFCQDGKVHLIKISHFGIRYYLPLGRL